MKTPALIEAIFRIDERDDVVRTCTVAWNHTLNGIADCQAQYMPTGMTPHGAWIVKLFVALVLLAALAGVIKGTVTLYGAYQRVWAGCNATWQERRADIRLDAEMTVRYLAWEAFRFALRTAVWLLVLAALVCAAQVVFQ